MDPALTRPERDHPVVEQPAKTTAPTLSLAASRTASLKAERPPGHMTLKPVVVRDLRIWHVVSRLTPASLARQTGC